MSKLFDVPVRRVKVATLASGAGLNLDADTRIDLAGWDGWRSPNPQQKPMLLALELKISGGAFILRAGSAALKSMFLNYMLDITSLKGPGGIELIRAGKGWHRPIWNWLQAGEVRGLRPRDLAAPGGVDGNYTRTFTQFIDFVEHRALNPFERVWPAEAFTNRSGGAELIVRAKSADVTLFKAAAASTLHMTSATLEIWAHLTDVAAKDVTLPAVVLESSVTGLGTVNPDPGPGAFLRVVMANSPAPADNGAAADDDNLSAYAQLDYFGYTNHYAVQDEDVALYMQKVAHDVSDEAHSQLDDNSGNKAEYRLLDPQENFDGHVRGIPLIYPKLGAGVMAAPIFADPPKLGANGNSRAGLPTTINFLIQQVVPRTNQQVQDIVNAMTDVRGRAVSIGKASPHPSYRGADPSRVPMKLDLS